MSVQAYRREDITVIVRTMPGRGATWDASRRTIEASDIGARYLEHEQPPDLTEREWFLVLMERMTALSTPLVLMLEDDAIVNAHILHNLATWPDLHDPRFGAGWCMTPGGRRHAWDRIYKSRRLRTKWHEREYLHASVGVLFRIGDLPAINAKMTAWYGARGGPKGAAHADLAISSAVWRVGKRIAQHSPSLVEHPVGPSTLGHVHGVHNTSRGHFNPTWKRAVTS